MKNLWRTFIVVGLLLALIIQAPDLNEAKKIKKLVKELKKLKKYAYLLAATKKKLYAIPFPMPLPVFVKRQHIYTQVPIIPRYVQQPQHYGSPAVHSAGEASAPAASYELMSDSSPVSVYPKAAYSSSASSPPGKHKSSYGTSQAAEFASQYLGPPGKYLSQIVSLLGQATPMSTSSNRDLLSKLLNGQARLLPPSALLSTIKSKGPAASLQALKQYEQEQHQHQEQQEQQDSKAHSSSSSAASSGGSSSSSSSSLNGVNYDDAPTKTTSKPAASNSESSANAENKPSASELYKSALAFRPMGRPVYAAAPLMNPFQFPAMMAPMMSPMGAALVAAQRAQALAAVQRVPMLRPAAFAANMIDQLEGSNQLGAGEPQDPQEIFASASQEHETVSRDFPNASMAALLRHRQMQQQQQQHQQPPERVVIALQKLQREQLLSRQQRAIKLALLREQEVAARLAESRQMLLRAHQMGLPQQQQQQNLLATYAKQLAVS